MYYYHMQSISHDCNQSSHVLLVYVRNYRQNSGGKKRQIITMTHDVRGDNDTDGTI